MDMEPEPKPFAASQQGRPVYGMPPGPRPRRSRLLLVGLAVIAVFTAFAAVVWMAHDRGAGGSPVGEPPLIRAATTPIKLSPDQADGSDVADQGEVRELLSDLPFEQQLERLLPLPEEPLPAPEELLAQPSAIGRAEPSPPPAPAPEQRVAVRSQPSGQAGTAPQPPPDQMAAVQPRPSGQAGRPAEPPAGPASAAPPQRAESPEPASPSAEPSRPMIEPAPPRPPVAALSSEAASSRPASPRESEQSAEAALDALIAEVTQRPPQQPDRRPEATGSRPEAVTSSGEPTASSTPRPREPQTAATTPSRPLDGTSPGAATGREAREPVITVAPSQGQGASDPGYRVQLAAVRESADAQRAWDLFMLDLGPVLSRYQPYFERANTANGIFYRVQIGSFASAESAESVCDELKRRNASCFVVRR
jgi:SPOR domain